MVITRTPFRISFFGGGTDYPVWYKKHGGAVLSTTIDKYCYITCRDYPQFFGDITTRVVWSKIENVSHVDEIEHPAVKAAMKFFKMKQGIEVHHTGDLPARSGLGAGSSFVVGFVNAINALHGKETSPSTLVNDAIHIERNLMNENVGSQDQVAAAFGGFNIIRFNKDESIEVTPLSISPQVKEGLRSRLLLFFTGLSRSASDIAAAQITNTPSKEKELMRMQEMVEESVGLLQNNDLDGFGRLLHEAWQLKRSLSDLIATPQIDEIYGKAMAAGALGGKILGAGGGGFILFYVDPSKQKAVREALSGLISVPIHFESEGSKVIYRSNGLDSITLA